jgi:hypothetical protein
VSLQSGYEHAGKQTKREVSYTHGVKLRLFANAFAAALSRPGTQICCFMVTDKEVEDL